VFVDHRGIRAERIELVRLAVAGVLWPDPAAHVRAVAELRGRYGVAVVDAAAIPQWVLVNAKTQGAPPDGATVDLDALLTRLGLQSVERLDNPTRANVGGR
jgi:hypothetical protein